MISPAPHLAASYHPIPTINTRHIDLISGPHTPDNPPPHRHLLIALNTHADTHVCFLTFDGYGGHVHTYWEFAYCTTNKKETLI